MDNCDERVERPAEPTNLAPAELRQPGAAELLAWTIVLATIIISIGMAFHAPALQPTLPVTQANSNARQPTAFDDFRFEFGRQRPDAAWNDAGRRYETTFRPLNSTKKSRSTTSKSEITGVDADHAGAADSGEAGTVEP